MGKKEKKARTSRGGGARACFAVAQAGAAEEAVRASMLSPSPRAEDIVREAYYLQLALLLDGHGPLKGAKEAAAEAAGFPGASEEGGACDGEGR